MTISKPVKLDRKYTVWDRLRSFFWPVYSLCRKIRRSFDWAVYGWDNYDWDHGYLIDTMVFKLKRMEDAVLNGHHLPDRTTDKSLRLAIKLGEKLRTHDYGYFADLHSRKWGEIEFVEKEENGRKFTGMARTGVTTPAEEEQEYKESREAYRKDDSINERDIRWFFGIVAKYHKNWWD